MPLHDPLEHNPLENDIERELDATYRAARELAAKDAHDYEPWRINDLSTATWASRKAATAARRLEQIKAWKQEEQERLDRVFDRMARDPQDTLEFMTDALADYLQREITAGNLGDKKSLPLMGGTIALRAATARPSVKDEAAFIKWAKDTRPDLIRTTDAVDKTALNKAAELAEDGVVTIDGEIIDALTWEQEPDKASFSPGTGRSA